MKNIKNIIHNLAAEGGIDMLDLGSGGGLDAKWRGVAPLCNLMGFDPNEEECRRLETSPNDLRSARFLPHAVSGQSGVKTLYLTRSPWCSSLLRPNHRWLSRLEFRGLFDVVGERRVNTVSLATLPDVQSRDFDIVKLDVQGMELPILRNCGQVLDRAFAVETETGFVENYEGETTFGEIDIFMRSKGFRLFDLTTHRQPRSNAPGRSFRSSHQFVCAEAIWLKDYIQLAQDQQTVTLTRKKCLAALAICAATRACDFGAELAKYFVETNLLGQEEVAGLQCISGWTLPENRWRQLGTDLLIAAILVFPQRARKMLLDAARAAVDRKAWATRARAAISGTP